VYCATTREVDEITGLLVRFGIPAHRYHGKLPARVRESEQARFMAPSRPSVMVATSAFGLGIDKSDVRFVLHAQSPASLEQYVQEAGRAGRDGRRAHGILLHSDEDRAVHEALLARSRVRPDQLVKLARALAAWAAEGRRPTLESLALSAELGPRATSALLVVVEEAGLVRWEDEELAILAPPDTLERDARALAGRFETLRTQDARRLDAVAAYADAQECRATFLRRYFGEDEAEPCGLCDVCHGGRARPDSFWEPLDAPRRRGRGRGRGRGRRPRARA
jgi:ATP-dependent DNA helicase RecQ